VTWDQLCGLLTAVIESEPVQDLWNYADQGMPVFAHSMDVAALVVDRYPDWRERFPGFRLDVVLLGSILHDLTKASAKSIGFTSHSHIMEREPTVAVAAAGQVLDLAQAIVGVSLDGEGIDHLWHVIAAHHGPWGKVSPQTPEAALLYQCDNYSATHRRVAPFDANDVLALLADGHDVSAIARMLGVGRSLVKNRLKESTRASGLGSPVELLERWRDLGAVPIGDVSRMKQIEAAKAIVEFARACPLALVERVRPLAYVANGSTPLLRRDTFDPER
jgi:hypothetical protein